MTTDEPSEPNVHTHEYTDDLPDYVTPLDRVNPLTGRGPGVREFGTATGRITPNEPRPQHLPGTGVPGLTPRTVERNVLPAMDLLERAAELIFEDIDSEGSMTDVPKMRDWLAAYSDLADHGDSGSEDVTLDEPEPVSELRFHEDDRVEFRSGVWYPGRVTSVEATGVNTLNVVYRVALDGCTGRVVVTNPELLRPAEPEPTEPPPTEPSVTALTLLGQAGSLLTEFLEGPDPEPLTEHLRGVAHEHWYQTAVAWVERYRAWVDD